MSKLSYLFYLLHTLNKSIVRKTGKIFCYGSLKSIVIIVITTTIITYTRTSFQNKWIIQIAYKTIIEERQKFKNKMV